MNRGTPISILLNMPAPESWLKAASREPGPAARLSHGLFRNAPKDHPESSSPATKAVITAVTEACVRESRSPTDTRNPAFFRRCSTSRQAFSVPTRGMARGGRQKFTPSGRPPPPSSSPCRETKVIPPKTSRSSSPLSGMNSESSPLGCKTHHPFGLVQEFRRSPHANRFASTRRASWVAGLRVNRVLLGTSPGPTSRSRYFANSAGEGAFPPSSYGEIWMLLRRASVPAQFYAAWSGVWGLKP